MTEFLLEIHSEEIPANFQQIAAQNLKSLICEKLEDLRLEFVNANFFVTPRRIVIFIENIPILPSEKRNEAKRFVSLIDALYDNRKRVFISAEGQPDEIYKKGDSQFEFKRCVSRLHEMRSKEYL